MAHTLSRLTLCSGPYSLCGVCFSLNLKKSTYYLSLCLSLNSFCDEASRTWAPLCPETSTVGLGWKAMAPHSSTLAWKLPWMEEPGRLQSMGSLRVGHDWATSLSLFTFIHWRRKWQPTPALLPGESQGRGSLVGCRLWGRTELDTTEVT